MYRRTEAIGRGKFGVVYKGIHKQTKQVVAIKVLNLDTADDEVAEVQQEIQFLAELKNVPNVTHYYGSFLNDTRLWIIMEYCAGGSLRTLLKAGTFEDKYIGIILRELLVGLSTVHKLGFIHRDIKAANILITKDGSVQLCDFGVAAKITSNAIKRTTIAGTPYWMAPEVIKEGETYNSKADVWSLGITVYEMATGNPPYCDKDAMWAMQLISRQVPPRLEGREYQPALKEFIALCLDENPLERPSAEDLLKSKIIKIYKNLPRSVLREVISNYLHWRDHNPSRNSVFVSIDDEIGDRHSRRTNGKSGVDGDPDDSDTETQIQVKWDFDSLSSKDYMLDDTSIDANYQAHSQANDEFDYFQSLSLSTLRADSVDGFTMLQDPSKSGKSTLSTISKSGLPEKAAVTEVPKSLQLLFEVEECGQEEAVNQEFPSINHAAFSKAELSFGDHTEAPTIEIPDIDNMPSFNTILGTKQQQAPRPEMAGLYKALSDLTHSQQKPGFRKQNGHTLSSNLSAQWQAQSMPILATSLLGVAPSQQIPVRQGSLSSSHSPSSNPPLLNMANLASMVGPNGSPSRSMKALQGNTTPMLQPINHKSYDESTVPTKAATSQEHVHVFGSTTDTNDTGHGMEPGSIQSAAKQGRPRPGFHIQMPAPSNAAFNNLGALTAGDGSSVSNQDENVNQFGINPAQAAGLTMSMTPVHEKELLFFDAKLGDADSGGRKERSDSLLQPRPKQTHSLANLLTASVQTAPTSLNSNVFLNKTSPTTPATMPLTSGPAFPAIPAIKSAFFVDSTPKLKLIADLENMISQFGIGLDILESQL